MAASALATTDGIPIRRAPFRSPYASTATTSKPNPLPQILHTPSGLAILEMQGTINLPEHPSHDSFSSEERGDEPVLHETPIGRLVFPDYDPSAGKEDTKWMKRVYLYVGMHQRLPGEVKKLPKPLAVLRKAEKNGGRKEGQDGDGEVEELQIVEIVKWKILFSQRPEPVGTWAGEG